MNIFCFLVVENFGIWHRIGLLELVKNKDWAGDRRFKCSLDIYVMCYMYCVTCIDKK